MCYKKWILATAVTVSVLSGSLDASQTTDQQGLKKSVVLIRSVKQDFDYVTPWKQKALAQDLS